MGFNEKNIYSLLTCLFYSNENISTSDHVQNTSGAVTRGYTLLDAVHAVTFVSCYKLQEISPPVTLLVCKNNYTAGHTTICICLKFYTGTHDLTLVSALSLIVLPNFLILFHLNLSSWLKWRPFVREKLTYDSTYDHHFTTYSPVP